MSRRLKAGLGAALAAVVVAAVGAPSGIPGGPRTGVGAEPAAYLFLSPNTEDDLPFDEARRRLRSEEQARGRRLAAGALDRLGVRGHEVRDALGDWEGGAENSVVVAVPGAPDPAALCCAAAWFGLLARQRAVAVFLADDQGPHALYRIDVADDEPDAVRSALDRHGVPARTLLPTADGHAVLVYDTQGDLGPGLGRFAAARKTALRRTPGTVACLGGATRADAERQFREVIRRHEAATGLRFARNASGQLLNEGFVKSR
jgi:hypothetical protein